MLVIPAIDIKDGKVVRLQKGDYNLSKEYNYSPVEVVNLYQENGFKRIHIVDLSGSKGEKPEIIEILKSIKNEHEIFVEFGGGIRNYNDINTLLDIGIDKLIIGSMCFFNKDDFEKSLITFGADKFILAADVLEDTVRVKGWTIDSSVNIVDHIHYGVSLGIEEYLITDISKDGMLQGPSFALYEKIQKTFPNIRIITSGGISCMDDIKILNADNYFAAVVGKAIYEGKVDLTELKKYAG